MDTIETGDLFRYFGMKERPICVGVFLEITNEDLRIIAELLGSESGEAFVADRPDIGRALLDLADVMLGKAAEMDREASA